MPDTLDSSVHDIQAMMIQDPISRIQDLGPGSRLEVRMIAVEQVGVGGVRRGRDVASHPRLACPMLQPRMPRTTTLPCYIHSTASFLATQYSALPL